MSYCVNEVVGNIHFVQFLMRHKESDKKNQKKKKIIHKFMISNQIILKLMAQ